MSVLISFVLFFNMFQSSMVSTSQLLGTKGIDNQPEKLIFCTFEEGTTNVSYTPIMPN